MKNIRRILGILLALCLVLALPLQAAAETYDISKGDVNITAYEDGSQYSDRKSDSGEDNREESDKGYKESTDTVITGSSSGENVNTVTISSSGGATAEVTFDNVSIDASSSGGENISTSGEAAVSVQGNASINLEGKNKVSGGDYNAGVEVGTGSSVTISGGEGASLEANGGFNGAGIGGAYDKSGIESGNAGSITINSGEITATGGNQSAGIGGGYHGDASSITINGGEVTAQGGSKSAGIGGGQDGGGGTITINGGEVTAQGAAGTSSYSSGAGIGGGSNHENQEGMTGGTITINGGVVNARAGALASGYTGVPSEDIGGGGGKTLGESTVTITGGTVNGTNYGPPAQPEPTPQPQPEAPASQEEDSSESQEVRDSFWDTIGWQVSTAQEGSTFPIDAAHRTLIPSYVVKTARSRNITLVITWDGGEDITIAPDAEVDLSQWCVCLKDL